MPNRRKLRFDDWDAVLEDVRQLQANGYVHAERGNWTLGQICSHLAVVMECAVNGFPKQMPSLLQKLLRLFFLPSNLRHQQLKMRAPAPPFAVPPESVSDEQGVARLQAAVEQFRKPDVRYDRHAAFGELTRDEWKHQQLWHCEHHLSYLVSKTAADAQE